MAISLSRAGMYGSHSIFVRMPQCLHSSWTLMLVQPIGFIGRAKATAWAKKRKLRTNFA